MKRRDRERFDQLLDEVIAELPSRYRDLFDETPLIVEDEPSRETLVELLDEEDDRDERTGAELEALADELCGLHTGIALTERSVEDSAELPNSIHIFRRGVIGEAGGWDQPDADAAVKREIRITLLHEMGHEFGLDEDDLAELGYD